MARHQHRVVLTIANGQTTSNEFKGPEARVALGEVTEALLYAPGTLPETVTVQVAPLDQPAGGDYVALQNGGSDVTAVAAKAKPVTGLGGARALRLVAGGAVAADRVFNLVLQMDSTSSVL